MKSSWAKPLGTAEDQSAYPGPPFAIVPARTAVCHARSAIVEPQKSSHAVLAMANLLEITGAFNLTFPTHDRKASDPARIDFTSP